MGFAAYLTIIAQPIIIRNLTNDYRTIGMAFGLGAISYTVSSYFLSGLSDRFGRIRGLLLGLSIVSLSNALVSLRLSVPALYVYNVTASVGLAFFFTAMEGLVSEQVAHGRALAWRVALYNFSWSSGDLLGVIAGSQITARLTSGTFPVASLVALFSIAVVLSRNRKEPQHSSVHQMDFPDDTNTRFFARISRWGVLLTNTAGAAILSLFPKYLLDLGVSVERLGFLIAMWLVTATVTYLVLGKWEGWHFNYRLHLAMASIPIGGSALLLLGKSFWSFAPGMALFGLGFACSYTFSLYYSLRLPVQKSRHAGIHEAFLGFGGFAGPLLGGILAQAYGGRVLFLGTLAIGVLSLVLQGVLMAARLASASRTATD